MSDRLRTAKQTRPLFVGRMDGIGSYFTDDVVCWVAVGPHVRGDRICELRDFTDNAINRRFAAYSRARAAQVFPAARPPPDIPS